MIDKFNKDIKKYEKKMNIIEIMILKPKYEQNYSTEIKQKHLQDVRFC